MRKKRLMGLLFSLSMAIGACAQSYTLVISLTTGAQERYQLSERPVVWFDASTLEVRTGTAGTTIDRSIVKDFTFEEATDGIAPTLAAAGLSVTQLPDGNIAVSGLPAGGVVTVYDAAGKQLQAIVADASGKASTTIPESDKGLFLININNTRTLKILKK